ncbi:MAG: DNA repair protein RecO [Prevotella sp.]|jgi:DNA repair protein RecO (recombination protein O)|nr:DNA repair protein RecO [Prevotella sp.]
MEVKTKAIVLRTVKYGESRIIVDLLTREAGRVSMVCQLTKSGKGKIKKQLLQPMTMLDVAFDYRKNISLQHFQDLRIGQVYRSLLFDPYKLSITLFLAEFLIYATRDETDNRQLYDFIETSLLWLDNADGGFANFHLVFMLRISLFIGFYPNLDDYHEGCWFDLREGCFTPLRPSHNDCLKPDEAARMRTIMRMSLDNMHLFRMSRVERNRCAEIILYYYRLHQSDFPELRSIEVLKELF